MSAALVRRTLLPLSVLPGIIVARQSTIRSRYSLQCFGKLTLMPSASHHPVQYKVVGERQLAHIDLKSSPVIAYT